LIQKCRRSGSQFDVRLSKRCEHEALDLLLEGGECLSATETLLAEDVLGEIHGGDVVARRSEDEGDDVLECTETNRWKSLIRDKKCVVGNVGGFCSDHAGSLGNISGKR
jgi:hypothetical protein